MTTVIKKPLIVTSACVINLLLFLFAYLMVTQTPQSISGLEDINLINFIRLERPPAPLVKQPDRMKPQEPPPPEKVPLEKVPPVPKLAAKTPPPVQIKLELPTPDINLPASIEGAPYTLDDLENPPELTVTDVPDSSVDLSMPEIISEIQHVPDTDDDLKRPPELTVTDVPDSSETSTMQESTSEIEVVPDTNDDLNSSPELIATDVPDSGDDLNSPPAQTAVEVPERGEASSMPKIIINITPKVRIEPKYPSRALRAGIEGTVTVEFTIAVDGSLKDIEIVSADPPKIFDYEVLKVLKRWKFSPQTVDGKTVEKRARQDIRFLLRK